MACMGVRRVSLTYACEDAVHGAERHSCGSHVTANLGHDDRNTGCPQQSGLPGVGLGQARGQGRAHVSGAAIKPSIKGVGIVPVRAPQVPRVLRSAPFEASAESVGSVLNG